MPIHGHLYLWCAPHSGLPYRSTASLKQLHSGLSSACSPYLMYAVSSLFSSHKFTVMIKQNINACPVPTALPPSWASTPIRPIRLAAPLFRRLKCRPCHDTSSRHGIVLRSSIHQVPKLMPPQKEPDHTYNQIAPLSQVPSLHRLPHPAECRP